MERSPTVDSAPHRVSAMKKQPKPFVSAMKQEPVHRQSKPRSWSSCHAHLVQGCLSHALPTHIMSICQIQPGVCSRPSVAHLRRHRALLNSMLHAKKPSVLDGGRGPLSHVRWHKYFEPCHSSHYYFADYYAILCYLATFHTLHSYHSTGHNRN